MITGEMLIGKRAKRGSLTTLRAFNPALGSEIEPSFGGGGQAEVNEACSLAGQAFDSFRETSAEVRARFLETIGQALMDLGSELVDRACAESGLPQARIEGERARTAIQLKLFATVVRAGRWNGATVDSALPDRKPLPRSDIRSRRIALGPVAIFGASNFPLAFSVSGGDTASALAAGCPVVAKAHPAHLGTSELVGRVIQQAIAECALHEGVFSLLVGEGNEIGEALVRHPAIKAVGFTGSRRGGLALMRIAAQRKEPIPVYAEMSSINPVFLLPHALAKRPEAIAASFTDSLTLGVGQFCTNPGLIVAMEGEDFERFLRIASEKLSTKGSGTMLTPGIHSSYQAGKQKLAATQGVRTLAQGQASAGPCAGQPELFAVDAAGFLAIPHLMEEVFGPSSLMISCQNIDEMCAVAEHLEGQLTSTLHLEAADNDLARQLLRVLERKAGRIVFNGFPTGVEVSYAMVHGGPFPATSDSRTTSVGAAAIERFLRPVCYQDMPEALRPEALQDSNPLSLWRLIDGQYVQK